MYLFKWASLCDPKALKKNNKYILSVGSQFELAHLTDLILKVCYITELF